MLESKVENPRIYASKILREAMVGDDEDRLKASLAFAEDVGVSQILLMQRQLAYTYLSHKHVCCM